MFVASPVFVLFPFLFLSPSRTQRRAFAQKKIGEHHDVSNSRKSTVYYPPTKRWNDISSASTLSSTDIDATTFSNNDQSDSISPSLKSNSSRPRGTRKQRPRLPVLRYEDQWVCINKPAGMTVHRNRNQPKSKPVVTTSLKRQLSRKIFPVHRLDHRTSGALILAFSSEMAATLQSALHNNQESHKTYIALLRGDWDSMYGLETSSLTVDRPLNVKGIEKESTTIFTKLAVGVINKNEGEGELVSAIDELDVEYDNDFRRSCTLVAAQPVTGRTHQIRRHAWTLNMPVLGDSEHGDSKVNRWWRQNKNLNRLALHCLAMDFDLPVDQDHDCSTSNRVEIIAPLPDDMKFVFQDDGALQDMWNEAVKKEPRLIAEWYDFRGGTKGIQKEWQMKGDSNQQS